METSLGYRLMPGVVPLLQELSESGALLGPVTDNIEGAARIKRHSSRRGRRSCNGLEPSKNIVRGFQAFELLLRRQPSWCGHVRFLALLAPPRTDLVEYESYGLECLVEADRIIAEFGSNDWRPIEVRVEESYVQAFAAYGLYDVLLVNAVVDGMNLVAMESPLVNERGGVLVLSRHASAWKRLEDHAVPTNPFDIDETTKALGDALSMPEDERARRARGCHGSSWSRHLLGG